MTTINAFYQWRILVMNAEQTETVYESGVFTTQPAQWSKAELWAVHYGYARLERRTVDTKPFAGSIAFGEQCHADKWHTIAEIES